MHSSDDQTIVSVWECGLIPAVPKYQVGVLIVVTSSIDIVCNRINQVGEDMVGFEGYTLYAG